jgi:DNA polymerase III subunit beta
MSMEILVNREHLLPILSRGASVVERRQTLPILGNMLLRCTDSGLTVVTTDLEVEVRGECQANIVQGGELTVPARKFLDIVRNLAEGSELRLKDKGDRFVISSGRGRYVLGTLPASDYPAIQADTASRMLSVEEGSIRRLIEKTWFAMAQQDVRYYLNGLLLEFDGEGIRGVATDGHRLARFDLRVDLDWVDERRAVILPYKTVVELRRQLSATGSLAKIFVGDRTIQFDLGDLVTTSKLIDGRFPDYEKVVGVQLGLTAVLDRERLRGALTRASVLSNEKYRGVRMEFERNVLRLQAHNPEQEEAVEEIDAVFDGDPVSLGFNVGYLADVLGAVEGDRVEVRFEDGNKSSIWRGFGASDETFVVMPMRL